MPGVPQLAYGNKQKPSRNERTKKPKRGGRDEEQWEGEKKEKVSYRKILHGSWQKKMEGGKESFHLRAATEVEANGGLKSYAIEKRRSSASPPRRGIAGSRATREEANLLTHAIAERENYCQISSSSPFPFVHSRDSPYLLIAKGEEGGGMYPPVFEFNQDRYMFLPALATYSSDTDIIITIRPMRCHIP